MDIVDYYKYALMISLFMALFSAITVNIASDLKL